jgi:ribonuclease J
MLPKKNDLWIMPLGGLEQVGANCSMIGNNGEWIIVDLGITFFGKFGIELLAPDISFPAQVKDHIKGIFITHAHEDHIGAVQYLWPQLRCPIYVSEFSAAVLRHKLRDCHMDNEVDIRIVSPKNQINVSDSFKIEYVSLAHSILGACGLYIKTKAGTVFHTGDWKIDDNPLLGDRTDEERLIEIGNEGVDCLLCDSTNSMITDDTISEMNVRNTLDKLVSQHKDKRITITCFASNVARLETIFQIARKAKRKIGLIGRSMHRMLDAVAETSYFSRDLKDGISSIIPDAEVMSLPPEQVLLVCTGSQGEARSALFKLARGENKAIKFGGKDVVFFSSKIIPGNEIAIREMQNFLVRNNVGIVTQEMERNIHVSGHPNRKALALMYKWLKPKSFIPIHGDPMMLRIHSAFAEENGIKEIMMIDSGDLVNVSDGKISKISHFDLTFNAVDGSNLVPLTSKIIRDREVMSCNGHISISFMIEKDKEKRSAKLLNSPSVVMNGIHVDPKYSAKLNSAIRHTISNELAKDIDEIRKNCSIAVKKLISRELGKKPIVIIHVHSDVKIGWRED